MYRKIVWCYVLVLTLLDISLNTKLSAQGKSHGATVHDSLIEGITFQEWGGGGARAAEGALALAPAALAFGRAALASPHARTVTLTNTANTTMHLASVAGTTPDFHASFFEAKTLPPQANTTFSVVYLGRREGPVAAHLYIHTSLGVHKYPVSAEGVASEWGVWPLVGVRVPLNATVEPLLTLYNPTDHTVQVSAVYSSGAWLALALPGGGGVAQRAAWAVPARASRPLVRLALRPHHAHHALTAYVRIKANITGGGLVVCVEARSAPAGEFLSPLQLRLRTRGTRDPPDVLDLYAGNSAGSAVALEARVWGARCGPAPPAPPPPPDAPPHAHANGNGDASAVGSGVGAGVQLSLLEPRLEAHAPLTRVAQVTFDYARLAEAGAGAHCGGWLALGRAATRFALRLLPGALVLTPAHVTFVTGEEAAAREVEVRARNEFAEPLRVLGLDYPPDLHEHFLISESGVGALAPGASAVIARVKLRAGAGARTHSHVLTLRTNITDYTLPLYVYSGHIDIEWEWPGAQGSSLQLGTLGASSTRRVRATLRHAAPVALCVRELALDLPGATLALLACAHEAAPPDHPCRCIPAGGAARARLTVVAPARAAQLRGALALRAGPGEGVVTRAALQLRALAGRLAAEPLPLLRAAPYAWASAPLLLESTMEPALRLADVTLPPDDPTVLFEPAPDADEAWTGRRAVGTVHWAPERACHPHCYTGLDPDTPEGAAWVVRGRAPDEASLRADAALQRQRHDMFLRAQQHARNISLLVHTSLVLAVPASGGAELRWPRLAEGAGGGAGGGAGAAPLSAVGAPHALRLRAHNPARTPLLLQPVLAGPLPKIVGTAEASLCKTETCVWSRDAFKLVEWRATRGEVREWEGAAGLSGGNGTDSLPPLLLAPGAELELKLTFTPPSAHALTAQLLLRNNLTVLEAVQLAGSGAVPGFELGGRRPGGDALLFEVGSCLAGGALRRTLALRNTGRVAVRLRAWRVAGAACAGRGWRVAPCAPLTLAPNASRALTLSFTPDYSLARASAALTLRAEGARAVFALAAAVPARLLPACAARLPRPPWEPALRAAAALLALAGLVLVLAAATLDAERELRRARAARPPPAPRQPLDLRALAQHAPLPPPRRAPPRRKRAPRPERAPLEPGAERRAFERWRADVLARAPDTDERSSEDTERASPPAPGPAPPAPAPHAEPPPPAERADDPPHEECAPQHATDGYEADPETEERGADAEEDAASSSSSSSASSDDTARDATPPAPARPSPPASPPDESRAAAPRARRELSAARRRAGEGGARARGGARLRKAGLRRRERTSPARSPAPAAGARAPGLRLGASWSSVVRAAAPPALAPIGSDVRRRELEAPRDDNSLFYFNGDAPRDDYWHALERPAFPPARTDYLGAEEGAWGTWGAAPAWPWGASVGGVGVGGVPGVGGVGVGGVAGAATSVRPPPGFAPRAVRPYDPFRSLASIWAPGALDWRPRPRDPAPDHH